MRAAQELILLCLFTSCVKCMLTHEKSFVKLRVPSDDYLLEISNHPYREYREQSDCAFACTFLEECEAFVILNDKCALGTMNMTDPHIPSYAPNGMDLMLRRDKVDLNSVSVWHLASLGIRSIYFVDDAVSVDGVDFSSVEMPKYPNKEQDTDIFGVTTYKDSLVACGGTSNSGATVLKTCYLFSFYNGAWTKMGGQLELGHFEGRLVVAGDKLWMFMGRADLSGGLPHLGVESYDLKRPGHWKREADAGVPEAVVWFAAAVYDETKVLLVGGAQASGALQEHGYIFDSVAGTYQEVPGHPFEGFGQDGRHKLGCGLVPSDPTAIMCGGGREQGSTDRLETRVFDTSTEQWRPQNTSQSLPFPTAAAFHPAGGELFAVLKDQKVYRFNPLAAAAADVWEVQEGMKVTLMRWGFNNFAYSLPYHRLLD